MLDHRVLREQLAAELPAGLLAHIDRVLPLAERLVRRHAPAAGAATEAAVARTLLAAQGHDLLRAVAGEELLARAERRGMDIVDAERAEPVLLHGPLGALELAERFGVRDATVLAAVRWHTTGHPAFGLEGWAMFIADKVEPNKLERWPALAEVAALAEASLTSAARRYLELSAERGAREGWSPHPQAVASLEALRDGAPA